MCGLIFVLRDDGKPAQRIIRKRFNKQKSRGTEGFGFISASNLKIDHWKRDTTEEGIIREVDADPGTLMLFHHRMPTSTPNLREATHPISVSHETLEFDYFFIHNGVISNADVLKPLHEARGFRYTTELENWIHAKGNSYFNGIVFNDSEALAVELALNIEGKKPDMATTGSIAFVGIQVNKSSQEITNIFYGRNASNPLVINHMKDILVIASEGSGKEVSTHTLFRYNPKEHKTYQVDKPFGYRSSAGYDQRDREYDDFDRHGYTGHPYARSRAVTVEDILKQNQKLSLAPGSDSAHLQAELDLMREEDSRNDDDITEISFETDPEGVLIELYEDKAKYEEYKTIAENANKEEGVKIWERRLVTLNARIKEIEEFLDKLELHAALEPIDRD